MRLRVVIPVLLLGALALLGALQLIPRDRGRPVAPDSAPPVAEPLSPAQPEPSAAPRPAEQVLAAEATSPESPAAKHETYVAQRCAELEDLATDDSSESLATILSELTNRDPDIRQAALNAAVQFGSRDAIPKLLEAVSQTDDPDEQVALLQAIKFLKLPTLSELAEQTRTNTVAGER